jgi:hypothetical protein
MNQITVNRDLCAIGLRVIRGPHWEWGDQDGGKGSAGTIMEEPGIDGWVKVTWDKGETRHYRVGGEGRYDLSMYNPFTSGMNMNRTKALQDSTDHHKSQSVQGVREAMSQSIRKADLLIEKSNTKHVNSNNTNSSGAALKVRRPISKIQGTKG